MQEDEQRKTNKLNIYLIKEFYADENSIIDEDSGASQIPLGEIGTLYYSRSHVNTPSWLNSFFNNHELVRPEYFSVSSAKAVLITNVEYEGKKRFFAIPFGAGRFFLKDCCWEERFGLITSLNILEANRIRALDKRTLSTNPKMSREQISKASEAIDFQIDYERDLVQAITGQSTDPLFGKIVTGKEALSVSTKIDITNLKSSLLHYIESYHKTDYKSNFSWIDQIMEVKSPDIVADLNKKLFEEIKMQSELVWLAIPEIIDWTGIKGFKYSLKKRDELHDELTLSDFINEHDFADDASSDDLKTFFVSAWNDEEDYSYKWNLYSCLNAEIDLRTKKYFLSSSKWYEINSDFVTQINEEFKTIQYSALDLPDYDHDDEGKYNVAAAQRLGAQCLDAQNISYGGGHSKIEFCDILTKDKNLIHVKKYGGSAVLSHLFAQGLVSAQLLLMDSAFREKVKGKLQSGFVTLVPKKKPVPSDYTIVYAIVSAGTNSLSIPFFSKVALKNCKRNLEGFGFNVRLQKVLNKKGTEEIED
jgi:uncharacterized protein (TIGR04141 family)